MQIVDIIEDQYQKAKTILGENMVMLHKLADYLLEKETITGEEFMSILEGKQRK